MNLDCDGEHYDTLDVAFNTCHSYPSSPQQAYEIIVALTMANKLKAAVDACFGWTSWTRDEAIEFVRELEINLVAQIILKR